jgi:leucyl aminopeptidase (aminopeptidase T)
MRVAVHQDDGTVFAYKVGNVIDGTHNHNLLTGEITPVEQVVQGLVTQAKSEYPQHKVLVEELIQGQWVEIPDEVEE